MDRKIEFVILFSETFPPKYSPRVAINIQKLRVGENEPPC